MSEQGSLLKSNDTTFKNGFDVYIGDRVSLAYGVVVQERHILEMINLLVLRVWSSMQKLALELQ
jgi:hypothetical protein